MDIHDLKVLGEAEEPPGIRGPGRDLEFSATSSELEQRIASISFKLQFPRVCTMGPSW